MAEERRQSRNRRHRLSQLDPEEEAEQIEGEKVEADERGENKEAASLVEELPLRPHWRMLEHGDLCRLGFGQVGVRTAVVGAVVRLAVVQETVRTLAAHF